jgi:hypothetical protein
MKKTFPLIALLFSLLACTTFELHEAKLPVTTAIFQDKEFVKMFSDYSAYSLKLEKLKKTTTDKELDRLLAKEVSSIRQSFRILDGRYKDFDLDVRKLLARHPLPERLIQARQNGQAKGWEGETPGYPCGATNSPNCPSGSNNEIAVSNCITGCQYSEVSCLNSNVNASTCSSIKTQCRQTCCEEYCGSSY